MPSFDKPRLRRTLKMLREVSFDRTDPVNVATAPQEMLEFLAVVAGLKPVFLLGRGFDDPSWIAGVSRVGSTMKLYVILGSKWDAEPQHLGLPDWYSEVASRNSLKEKPVVYICKLRAVAQQVIAICESNIITMRQEADLLGYPICCVQHHYIVRRAMNAAFSKMLQRYAKGNTDEMKNIVRNDIQMIAETPDELSDIRLATEIHPAPFTGFNMCPYCASNADSAGMRISGRYASFARTVDEALADEITKVQLRFSS